MRTFKVFLSNGNFYAHVAANSETPEEAIVAAIKSLDDRADKGGDDEEYHSYAEPEEIEPGFNAGDIIQAGGEG